MNADLLIFTLVLVVTANFLFVLLTFCLERKNAALALSWVLILLLAPVVGFALYFFCGNNIRVHKRRTLARKKERDLCYRGRALAVGVWPRADESLSPPQRRLARLNAAAGGELLSGGNGVEIFISAQSKYERLLADIAQARQSVHLLYFIIRGDRIGRRLVALLAQKAAAGVKVRLLYDHAGSILTPPQFFLPLTSAGGEVRRFFPVGLGNYLRVNFRNHRKIAVLDGRIGYLGGMNIGDEYLGEDEAHAPWRDTHLRLTGPAVRWLQLRFFQDWQFAAGYRQDPAVFLDPAYFPPPAGGGTTALQIVSSGPDTGEEEIKWNFLQMIYSTAKRLYLQTPYFVPDEAFLEAVKIAALSGVDVRIMTTVKTDNHMVHKVSLSYLAELLDAGVRVYLYPGFLHAKMILADDTVSIGSSNFDMRSFALNFETNAFLYDGGIARQCRRIFVRDLRLCRRFTAASYRRRGPAARVRDGFYRLLSPLL